MTSIYHKTAQFITIYSLKGALKKQTLSVHENNIPNKCKNCDQNHSFKGTLKNILNQFKEQDTIKDTV